MNTSGISTLAAANVVTPFDTVGRTAVGLENAEAKEEALSPVEQASETAAPFNRDTDTPSEERAEQQQDEERAEQRRQQQEQQQQQQQIRQLASREREVIAHEQAHAAVGGQYTGSPSYTFERGPNGVNYAVGGEVAISLPAGGDDPAATLAAARQVREAALAPADPSVQDRTIAAEAARIESQAAAELAAQNAEQQAAAQAEKEEAAREAEREQQAEEEQQRQQEINEQRLLELRRAARRSIDIGDQLITLDNLQRELSVGSVVDQRA